MHFFSYQIEHILEETKLNFNKNINLEFDVKFSPKTWSKKEILGHLVDSAINNLRRFTECQFSESSYLVMSYDQDELVKKNKYQEKNILELFDLWYHLNKHIVFIIKDITKEQLNIKINLYNFSIVTLEFLIDDYITHMKHHLKQIFEG